MAFSSPDVSGGSYIYKMGTTPNTRTAVSQKNRILAPAYGSPSAVLTQVGVLSSFEVSESRSIDPVRGIGFGDQIAELVPSPTDPTTISITRTLLYLSNAFQQFGYAGGVDGPVRSLRHHRWPFDIESQLVFSEVRDSNGTISEVAQTAPGSVAEVSFRAPAGSHQALITLYEACWFNDYGYGFSSDDAIVAENVGITVTDVTDFSSVYGEFLRSGNDPLVDQIYSVRFGQSLTPGSVI